MAKKTDTPTRGKRSKKKTRQGQSNNTKYGRPGAHGGNKNYKKKHRGQGRKR